LKAGISSRVRKFAARVGSTDKRGRSVCEVLHVHVHGVSAGGQARQSDDTRL
jgi:hypothetical protein